MKKTSSSGNGSLTINESRTMKKIYSLMVAAVAMFAAASCTQELENNVPEAKGETVVYTASTDGADTKAVLNETTKKSEWVANDAITVLDKDNNSWTFTTASAGANVDFSNSEGFGGYRPVLAVYPAAGKDVTYTANVEAKTAKAYIPTWQQAQAGTYHSSAALAVAYSEDNTFAFKNAHALLKFTVNTDNVTHVIFHGNGSEAITGDVYVTLGEEGVESVECLETVFTSENEQVSETKYGTWVECYAYHDDANKYFVKGETYYIAVAPQKFEGGVTVKVRINEGEELVAKSTAKPVETKVNTILDLGEIKYEAPVVHEWAIAGTFNEWSPTANSMELVDGYYVAKNITGLNYTAPTGEETGSSTGVKFVNKGEWRGGEGPVAAGVWAYVWGDGGNIYVEGASAEKKYDIYLNPSEGDYGKFVVVAAGEGVPEDNPAEVPEVVVGYWAVTGTMNEWGDYAKLTLDGDWHVATEVKLTMADQFKLRADGDWAVNRGAAEGEDGVVIENNVETTVVKDGKNFSVAENGMYSVYINKAATKVKVVRTGDIPLPSVKNWGIVGTITKWGTDPDIPMTLNGDWYIASGVEMPAGTAFKFRVDGKWASDGGEELTYSGSVVSGTEYNVSAGSSDISVTSGAIYDVYLSHDETKMKVVKVGDLPDPDIMAKDGYVYLLPNSNWTQGNARFSIYLCNGSKAATWISMTKVEGTAYYEVQLPSDFSVANYKHIIFVRLNPSTSANNWNDGVKWNQTSDLECREIDTNGKNCYAIKAGTWDKGGGTWSKVTKLN